MEFDKWHKIDNIYIYIKTPEYNNYIFIEWIGKYTAGETSIRGTRIWLHSNSGLIINSEMNKYSDEKFKERSNYEYFENKFNKKENVNVFNNFDEASNIRGESIDQIIDIFKGISDIFCGCDLINENHSFMKVLKSLYEFGNHYNFKEYNSELLEILIDKHYDLIEEIILDKYKGNIILDKGVYPCESIYFLNKPKEIIDELEKINIIGEENNATFIWI